MRLRQGRAAARQPPGQSRRSALPENPAATVTRHGPGPGCEDIAVAVSRADRRRDRKPRVQAVFADRHVGPVLDLLELLELAWHDCYHDISSPEDIIDDVLLLGNGSMDKLVSAAKLAITDWRDLKVAAATFRG